MNLPTNETLQRSLEAFREKFVGAAIAIGQRADSALAEVGSTGHKDGHGLDANSRFKWGSFTKVVTAFLVCQLAEAGQLTLDDELSTYLPRVGERIENGSDITIRMVLAHTAGLVDLFEMFKSADQMTDRLGEEGLLAPPGALFSYSNAGYALLGALIEAVTGASWRDHVRTRLIEPLSLRTVRLDYDSGAPDKLATLDHHLQGGALVPAPLWPDTGTVLEAAGSNPRSGISDLLVLALALLTGRPASSNAAPLLKPAMLREMQTLHARMPGPSLLAKGWGLGWSVDPDLGTVSHMGGTSAFVIGKPDEGAAGAFLSNTSNTAPLGQAALQTFFALPSTSSPKTYSASRADNVDAIIGRYKSPLFAIDVDRHGEDYYAATELAPEKIRLRQVGRREFVGTVMGPESIESEFNFLGDAERPSHLHAGLRALRRE